MDPRSLVLRTGAVVLVLVILFGAWVVFQELGSTVLVLFLAGVLCLGGIAYVISRQRGRWPSRVAGLTGCAVSWGLATLAYGIRSLCWGDPDLAARDSCDAQWVAAAFVLALVGCLSLIAGFWPSGRAGSGPS
jgi:hypothetical protein